MAPDPSSRKQNVHVWYIFAAGMAILLLQWWLATYAQVETIPFSQFEQLVAQGQVTEVAVGQDTIQGKVKDKLPSGKTEFVTTRVDPRLPISSRPKASSSPGCPSGGLIQTLLSWIVPAVILLRDLDVRDSPSRRPPGLWRDDVDRQVARQSLCREGHQGDLRRRCRSR